MRTFRAAILAAAAVLYSSAGNAQTSEQPADDSKERWSSSSKTVGRYTLFTVGALATVGAGIYAIRTLNLNGDVGELEAACNGGELGSCWRYEAGVERVRASYDNSFSLGLMAMANVIGGVMMMYPTDSEGRASGGKRATLEITYGTATALSAASAVFAVKMLAADHPETMSALDSCAEGDESECSRANDLSHTNAMSGVWAASLAGGSALFALAGNITEMAWANEVVHSARLVPLGGPGVQGAAIAGEF